jgi:hypothetical protein
MVVNIIITITKSNFIMDIFIPRDKTRITIHELNADIMQVLGFIKQ